MHCENVNTAPASSSSQQQSFFTDTMRVNQRVATRDGLKIRLYYSAEAE